MSNVTAIVSATGGTGRSVLAALMGAALARTAYFEKANGGAGEGFRDTALLIDLNAGARQLDMLLGMDSNAAFDVSDALEGLADLELAAASVPGARGLRVLAAPTDWDYAFDRDAMRALLDECRARFDWIGLDCPSGWGGAQETACALADTALVCVRPEDGPIRASESLLSMVRTLPTPALALAVCRADARLVAEGLQHQPGVPANLLDTPVWGVVPEDADARRAALRKALAAYRGAAAQAAGRLALRTLGLERVPARITVVKPGRFGKSNALVREGWF